MIEAIAIADFLEVPFLFEKDKLHVWKCLFYIYITLATNSCCSW